MIAIDRTLPAADYHAFKALSASFVHTFDSQCPYKAWRGSPWNPAHKPENANHFDIGQAAHLAVLEPEEFDARVTIIPASVLATNGAYSTTAAKMMRDAAYASGKTPLKPGELAQVFELARLIKGHPIAGPLFQGDINPYLCSVGEATVPGDAHPGHAEVSLQWDWNDIPCKARPDWMPDDYSYILDLKTCDSASPEAVQRAIWNYGWHVRASWYLAGTEASAGVRPSRYIFVMIEKDPPDCITLYELDNRALEYGDKIITKTLGRAGECLKTGIWPGYLGGKIGLPTWGEFKLADREEAGEI